MADDDAGTRRLLADLLESFGHEVLLAKDGYGAWQMAFQETPQLIVMDILMPEHYGSTVYKMLQNDSRTADIPIIFISALPTEQVRPLLPDDAKTRFIPKPLDLDRFQETVEELLSGGRRGV